MGGGADPRSPHEGNAQVPNTNTQRAAPSPMRGPAAAVRRAVASVSPIVTMWRDGLTIIALESREPNRPPEYLTFEQAQAAQGLAVEEAAVQTVPTVDATTGPMPVLLLGGDTIIGGAQNRIINITILLKAAAKTAIPVSCLEMGRWNDGRHFESSRPVDHTLRSMVAEQVTRGARADRSGATQRFAADQGAIWAEIGERQARAAHRSATQAIHDVYRAEERSLEEWVRAFPMPAGTRGIAVGINDRLVGLDLFDSAETLERQWPRLVGSAASALLDRQRAIQAGAAPTPRHRHVDSGALGRMVERSTTALADATVAPLRRPRPRRPFQRPEARGHRARPRPPRRPCRALQAFVTVDRIGHHARRRGELPMERDPTPDPSVVARFDGEMVDIYRVLARRSITGRTTSSAWCATREASWRRASFLPITR